MIQHTEHGITGSINDLPLWSREPGMGFLGALTVIAAYKVTETTPVSTPVRLVNGPTCMVGKAGFLAAHTNTPLGARACVCFPPDGRIILGLRYADLELAPDLVGSGGKWEARPEGKQAWREVEAESMQIVAAMTGQWWPHTNVEMHHPVWDTWHVRDGKILSMSLKSLSSRIFRLPADVPPDNE